jgi:hypothetical protein
MYETKNCMKAMFLMSVLILALSASSQCFAMRSIGLVSPKEAKESGMEIRLTPNGTNEVWVELEFKAEGKFKDFNHVSLEIRDGEKFLLGWAPLKEKRAGSGSVLVNFLANRVYLDKIALCVVVGDMGDAGWELRMKDFVEAGKAP